MTADKPFGFRTHPMVTSSALPEAVYDVIADLRNYLVWSGEMAEDDGFKMLSLDAPEGPPSWAPRSRRPGARKRTRSTTDPS